MFNRGISQLLEALPEFEGLDGVGVKRLLTSAYLEGLDLAALVGENRRGQLAEQLRRLVTALEVHAIFVPGVEEHSRRACAFVAAESLSLINSLSTSATEPGAIGPTFSGFGSRERYRRIEAALLYLIAAFDANAVIATRDIDNLPVPENFGSDLETSACEWAKQHLISLVRLSAPRDDDFILDFGDSKPELLVPEIRAALWQKIGGVCHAHVRWLRLEDETEESGAVDALAALGKMLDGETGAAYADLAHLILLLKFACDGMGQRALRRVPPPPGDSSVFTAYQARRCREKPLLWPSAERYRDRCLPGPACHAAISMPTGSGKSILAELAVAQVLGHGWVLYLAPTRALVRQVRRDLGRALGGEVEVREYLGGAEFTALADETLGEDPGRTVLVMTPEKCSLALRQTPEAFANLRLCIFDECHLIGELGNRGVLAELVLAQILHLASDVKVVMQSALLGNPEDIAAWLHQATGRPCESIDEPWRPTRTLRAVAGFDEPGLEDAQEQASHRLAEQTRRVHQPFDAPLNLLVNLQGPWAEDDQADYALAHTTLTAPLEVSRTDDGVVLNVDGYVNNATGSVAQGLVEAGHRVLAFIPGNKHHNFSVARDMRGFGNCDELNPNDWEKIEPLLDLADFELGTPSLLRQLLKKGVAVHTSAMLVEERRASEIAYDRGVASVVFATGTLAQGLNLPATAVVIGGINIGYDPNLTTAQRNARQQVQLLNAVGRAGRPYIAARSLAIVLPNEAWKLGPDDPAPVVRSQAAPFLAQEDASFALRSQLGTLVSEALEGELTVQGMGVEGLTAFAFLPMRSDIEGAANVLRNSYAVAGRPDVAEEQVQTVVSAMVGLGEQVLQEGEGPDWLVDAAYDSGLSLRQIVAMWTQVRLFTPEQFPVTIRGWANLLVEVVMRMPYSIVGELIDYGALNGTKMRALADEVAVSQHPAAWAIFSEVIEGWLEGVSLTDLAATGVKDNAAGNSGRGSGNPLPKIIGLTEQLMVFSMTRVAGGLAVLISSALEQEVDLGWELSPHSARALEQLSMGIRAGCGDEASLAWWRFGGFRQRRRLAHLAAKIMPPPDDALLTDESAQAWVHSAQPLLTQEAFEGGHAEVLEDERKALAANALLGIG